MMWHWHHVIMSHCYSKVSTDLFLFFLKKMEEKCSPRDKSCPSLDPIFILTLDCIDPRSMVARDL